MVGVVGPPGIGKSRLLREAAAMARQRSVEVFITFCESHTSQVPFHAVARLLHAATGVEGLDGQEARDHVRDRIVEADREDLLLFDDLLGSADPDVSLSAIDRDARRRRLTALVNAASLARVRPHTASVGMLGLPSFIAPRTARLQRCCRSTPTTRCRDTRKSRGDPSDTRLTY